MSRSFAAVVCADSERADTALLCGDLVDCEMSAEANILANEIANLNIPKLAVLGNHEFESGKQDEAPRDFAIKSQYLTDVDAWDYKDARHLRAGPMTLEEGCIGVECRRSASRAQKNRRGGIDCAVR